MQSNIEIGKRIEELRKSKGLTQTELSKILRVKRETISQWENGDRDLKSGYVIALADALDTDCDYILRGITTPNVDIVQKYHLSESALSAIEEHIKKWEQTLSLFKEDDRPEKSDVLETINGLFDSKAIFEICETINDYKDDVFAAKKRYLRIVNNSIFDDSDFSGAENFYKDARLSLTEAQDLFNSFVFNYAGEYFELKKLRKQAEMLLATKRKEVINNGNDN